MGRLSIVVNEDLHVQARETMSTNPPHLTSVPGIRSRLHDWYAAHARVLPWRSEPTPYRVWMSEIMLQQTRVDTAIPYFERFQEAYPTVEELAAAPEEEVLSHWAGLGYYRRARSLHAAARMVVERGGFPDTVEGLLELPGVGRYTAGAIASIAFQLPAPILDGNVARVLSRLLAYEGVVDKPAGQRHLWAAAELLVDPADPSGHNQGLMELGALICSPRSPRCEDCPLMEDCQGRAGGQVERYPIKTPRKKPVKVRAVAGLLLDPDRGILLARRPEGGLLGGLWEVPGGDWPERISASVALGGAWNDRLGVQVQIGGLLGEVEHIFTHRRLRLVVHEIESVQGEPVAQGYPEVRWVDRQAILQMPLSRLTQKVLATVGWDHG